MSNNPRLNAAHRSTCDLVTFTSPRNQLRRPPPVSHTCAKVRSHRSLRHRFSRFPLSPRTRRRFALNAASNSGAFFIHTRFFCFRSGIYVLTCHCAHCAKS